MDEFIKNKTNFNLVNRIGKAPISGVVVEKCDALNKQSVINVWQNASTVYKCLGLPYNEWKENYQ